MYKVFNYIFGSLQSSETAIKSIYKVLKTQKRFNYEVMALMWAASFYIYKQDREIKKLGNEIERLKCSEGE